MVKAQTTMDQANNKLDLDSLTPTEKVTKCMEVMKAGRQRSEKIWAPEMLDLTDVEYADFDPDHPTVVFRLHTQAHFANSYGFMHGGCVTTFIDNATTWSAFGNPSYWKPNYDLSQVIKGVVSEFGVSRNLNSTFVRPVPLNQDVILTCRIQSNSKRYTHITYELKDAITGKQLAVGSHDKAKPVVASKSKL